MLELVVEASRWRWVTGGVIAALLLTVAGLVWWQHWNSSFEVASTERLALPVPHKLLEKNYKAGQKHYSDDSTGDLLISTGADEDAAKQGLPSEAVKTVQEIKPESRISKSVNANESKRKAITPLHTAAISGDFDIVQLLLANGTDVNSKTGRGAYPGETPLHSVAYAGHTQIAELLLAYGAFINAADQYSYTPLRRTVEQGHLAMAKFLIQKGADVFTKDSNDVTLVHVVARTNHVAMAELLITGGADINAIDRFGFTPLDYAQGGGVRMAEMLERHGAVCTIC